MKIKSQKYEPNAMCSRTQRSINDNIIIMSATIEKIRTERLNRYYFLQIRLNVVTSCG